MRECIMHCSNWARERVCHSTMATWNLCLQNVARVRRGVNSSPIVGFTHSSVLPCSCNNAPLAEDITIVSHNESNVLLWIDCNDVFPVVTNNGWFIFSLVCPHHVVRLVRPSSFHVSHHLNYIPIQNW